MKNSILLIIVLVFGLLIAACGTAPAQATEMPMTDMPTAAASSSTDNSTTNNSASGTGTAVNIVLEDNTITPSQTDFKVGVKYTFTILNKGFHAHNFNISTPVSISGSIDASGQSALLTVTRDQLGPGATAVVDFTFPDTAAGQPLEFSCLITRHYNDGMHATITVSK